MTKSSRPRGRPETAPLRKLIAFDEATWGAVERFAEAQEDKPSRSEMVRRILTDYLTERGYLPK